MFHIGEFVEFDGLLAVVVGISGENGVPEDHLAVWFGEPQGKRKSEGGAGNLVPIVWTIPTEYFPLLNRPMFNIKLIKWRETFQPTKN